jgi:hypothetical protein
MTTNFRWKKSQQNTPSSFDWSYMYCCLQLGCKFFVEQWEQVMCCHVFRLLVIRNILLLFWNNLKHLIFMFGWFKLWHVVQKKLSTWHINWIFQIKFKSIFEYVGWIRYLPTYIPTYPSRLNTYLDRTYLPT